MTKEELNQEAEEWLDERYLKDMGVRKPCKEAYLAGFKAGRETEKEYVRNNAFTSMKEQGLFPFGKWHNLMKDLNDLPESHSVVLDENGDKVEYIGYGKWQVYSEYYERYSEVDPPIAWCELPTFKE